MTTANNPSTTTSNSALFSSDSSPVVANLADAIMLAALQPDKVSVTVSASFKETNTNSQVGLKFATTSSTMVNTDLGENLKDINLITTIRSRNLHFSAYHLKPLTKLYAFFDNVNVDAYISTAYKVILTTPVHSNYSKLFLTVGSNVEVLFARDTTIYINHSKLNNGTDIGYLKATDNFIWDSITYTIKEITQPTQLEVDSNGYVAGNFLIPNTSSISFNTGMRSFLLCDSPTNIGTEINTAAEFQYYAAGMAQTKQATTLSTMYNLVSVDPILRSKTTESSTKTAETTSVSPGEPLYLYIDKIAPTITAYSPPKGSTGIAVDRVINLTFSEPIQRGSGDISIVKSNGTILGTFNAATSPLISLTNGETTLQITPPANLSFLSLLTVNLPAGCVKDKVGNDYVGSYDYTFSTTYDASLPLVPISFFPSDGSVNVDVRKVIEVVFNENIAKGTGNITLRKGSATSPVIETYGPASPNLSTINSTLYITPTNTLDYQSQYFLVFEAASVKMATAPTTWGGTSIYDFSTEVAVVTVNNTFNTINNPIIDNTPGVVVVPASGNTPLGGGVMNVIDYDLDFTTATGECGIDIVNSLVADLTHQAPDAYQLFWDNNMVAGSGGSTDRPAFITTGDIPGPIKDKFGKKIGNGTFVKVDHIPSATNPIKYRFNKTKSLPNTAKLRVYTFGNAGWKQIMPPGVAVTTGAARFAITPLDSTFVPPKINGITGWEHWTGPTWVDDTTHPLDSNLPHHNNWEYKGPAGHSRWAEYGRGFVSFPAGNVSKTFTISNTGTASGSVDSISVNRSPDLLKAPALSLGEFNGVTTSISNVEKLSGSTYTAATFPVSLANGESLKFNVDITWPWIYYSPEFDWNAKGVATPVTVKKILALKNSVAIRADYKKKVIDKINKLRDYILRWEVVPQYANASVIPNSANIAMNSKSTAITQHDPLAQSFFVNDSEYPDGYFVSSIDLFFSKKSSSNDITVQIRPMLAGLPSATEIVPFAISTLPASSVNITDYPDNTNPLSYTKFKFDSPIYLSAGSYAIVVISTSKDYELYTSTVGSFKINNRDLRISEPPYSGDLFKSSNQQTWLPSPFQDLCFVLNRCDFDASGTLFFKSEKPENNYSSQYNKFIAETHYNHLDYIRVEVSPNTDNVYQVTSNGTSGTLAPTNVTGNEFINGTLTLKHLTVATRWEDVVVPYDVYFAQGENVVLNNSEALHFFKGTKESGDIDTDFSQIMLGSNYEMESRKVLDSRVKDLYAKIELSTADSKISPIIDITRLSNVLVQNIVNNETIAPDFIPNTTVKEGAYIKVLIGNSYKMYLVIRAGKTAASAPLFDTGDSLNGDALLRYLGSTHNGDTELLPYGGLALSKYITRKVILASGFESTDISVIFNANTPAGSTVKVYYKAANINGSTSLEQTPYHEMVLSERKSDYMTQYVEHKYICDYNVSVASSRRALPNGERFNQFAIKIVMLSSNTLVVPKIRDLRAMALDD